MFIYKGIGFFSFLLFVTACTTPTEETIQPTQLVDPSNPSEVAVDLVEPKRPTAVLGQDGWEYQRTASADFDGDGTEEEATLLANVVLYDDRPAWEDGHSWQLYIEEPDGQRTDVYNRFVSHGLIETRLTHAGEGEAVHIILMEQMPQFLNVYEIRYDGPERAQTIELLSRELDPSNGLTGTPN